MTRIARLHISLKDIKPAPMRQIEVPLKLTLDQLHDAIQAAMGWEDMHLYEFRVGRTRWRQPDPDGFSEGLDTADTTLENLLEQTGTRTIRYTYDFGDNWEHSLQIQQVDDTEEDVTYPRLLEATGACPPEDVGGPWGYEVFLEALVDPEHEQHEEMMDWWGEAFDPDDAGVDGITERFGELAKEWASQRR